MCQGCITLCGHPIGAIVERLSRTNPPLRPKLLPSRRLSPLTQAGAPVGRRLAPVSLPRVARSLRRRTGRPPSGECPSRTCNSPEPPKILDTPGTPGILPRLRKGAFVSGTDSHPSLTSRHLLGPCSRPLGSPNEVRSPRALIACNRAEGSFVSNRRARSFDARRRTRHAPPAPAFLIHADITASLLHPATPCSGSRDSVTRFRLSVAVHPTKLERLIHTGALRPCGTAPHPHAQTCFAFLRP